MSDAIPFIDLQAQRRRLGAPLDAAIKAAVEGGQVRRLAQSDLSDDQLRTLLARRSLRAPLKPYLKGTPGATPRRRPLGKTVVRSSIYHH